MNGLVMAAQLILSLSIIVTLHELGHFLAARAFGIKVEKFYLFFDAFGKKLFSIKKGDTEYGVGWLPLGGYVKIAGMIDESMDREAMKQEPQPWEFRSKPRWQQLIVMVAGVVVNFVVGVIIFAFITLNYEKVYLPADEVHDGIYSYELGEKYGFKTGDKIIKINGKDINRFKDLKSPRNLMGAVYTVNRNGEEVDIILPDTFYKKLSTDEKSVPPLFIDADRFKFDVDCVIVDGPAYKAGLKTNDKIIKIGDVDITYFGDFKQELNKRADTTAELTVVRGFDTLKLIANVSQRGTIGFTTKNTPYQFKEYTFKEGLKYGLKDGIGVLSANAKGLGKVISGEEKASESIQGPVGMAKIFGGEWKWPWFWYMTGLISLILGFMNILPIPALDGGHAMFLSIEMITRRSLSDKFKEYAQIVGMIILLVLMVFIIGNDIVRLIVN